MIRRCNTCSGSLFYDIESQKVKCNSCSNCYELNEVSNGPLTSDDEKIVKTIDCNVYTCNSCGAEIVINDNEVSTFCVYCGNSSIVFSRLDKLKSPRAIIPFRVSKERAEKLIRERLNAGLFIPKEIKNFKVDALRPIYIPYYISKVHCYGSELVSSIVGSGKDSTTYYYLRGGRCDFDEVTVDASKKLNDRTAERLEPYRLLDLKPFDENYLLGFYSDKADITPVEATNTARTRGLKLFEEALFESVTEGHSQKVISKRTGSTGEGKPLYALFPAWFLTFRYKDRPYTLLVNGQSGKIVGAVPGNKVLFNTLLCTLAILISILPTFLLGTFIYSNADYYDGPTLAVIISLFAVLCSVIALVTGIKKMKDVNYSLKIASETTLNQYANDRQSAD